MIHATSLLAWPNSADKMREALPVSTESPLRCQGRTKKQEGYKKPISAANRAYIQQLLREVVAAGSWPAAQQLFGRLSLLVLCRGRDTAQSCYRHGQARPSLVATNNITIKLEFKEPSSSASLYTVTQVIANSELKEEPSAIPSLSSIPSSVKDDPKLSHHSIPYGRPRTQLQANQAIQAILEKPLSPHEQKTRSTPGVVYIYKHSGAAKPHLKIGFSANLDRRMQSWKSRCGYDPKQMGHTGASLYARVERLVHAQLWACRKREPRCPGCGGALEEFFDVRLHEASKAVGLWAEWMENRPYGDDGGLKEVWRKKLREVDLTDADC